MQRAIFLRLSLNSRKDVPAERINKGGWDMGSTKRERMRAGLLMVASTVLLCSASPGLAAPAQLLNKTLSVSWTTSSMQRAPDGREHGRQITVNKTIYISSAGRLFERSQRTSDGGMRGKADVAPGDGQMNGQARGLQFSGDRLIGSLAFASGAVQYVVNFSGGFTSCTVNVVQGRSGGNMRIKGLDGRMYEILSTSVSGQSCSIREGNALAS
jgi:hypothetical protein